MKRSRAFVALTACLLLATGLSGCTSTAGMIVPNAHYVYPNSNVELLGAVSATKSKTGFFSPPGIKMDELEALYREALAQKDGDVLVNATFETKVTVYPIIPIAKAKFMISGTAAKMTVGKQRLGQLIEEDVRGLLRSAEGSHPRATSP